MKIRQGMEQKYKEAYDNNLDAYGHAIFTYAERWAELMEKDIEQSGKVDESICLHAQDRSREADTEGITGYMYGCAVSILAGAWEYGEPLRIWHNAQYNHNGEGVVNPAVLHIRNR